MTRELENQRGFYSTSRPEAIKKYFAAGPYRVSIGKVSELARKNLVPQIDIVTPQDLNTLEGMKKAFSEVEVIGNPNYQRINPETSEGKEKLIELTLAKGVALKEQSHDPKVASIIDKTLDKFLDGMGSLVAKVGRKKGLAAASMLAFGLTACGPQVIGPVMVPDGGPTRSPVTETAGVPTQTETPTPAPTETATPTPTEAPLPAGTITDFAEKLQGRYELHWKGGALVLTDAATKQEVPQISFDKDGSWTRAYNLPDIEEKFTAKGTISDIKIDQDKLGIQDWELVEGAWQRKTAEFATETAGKTVELPLTSLDEVQFEILNNNSSQSSARERTNNTARSLAKTLFNIKTDGSDGLLYLNYHGMHELNYKNSLWADNMILVPDKNKELQPVDTAMFVVSAFGVDGNYVLIGWIDSNEMGQVRVIKGTGLNKPSNFNTWYATHKH